MTINYFSIISTQAQPQNSVYSFVSQIIDNVEVLMQAEVANRENQMIQDACVFINSHKTWVSAFYTLSFNPSVDEEYNKFITDLKCLIHVYNE